MLAGVAAVDITPRRSVHMDGMVRVHRSAGVHDPLLARALYLAPGVNPAHAFVVVALDLFGLDGETGIEVRRRAERSTGVPAGSIILAASHTHSGPATVGYFNPRDKGYLRRLVPTVIRVIRQAAAAAQPAAAGCAFGREDTISHYRRLDDHAGELVLERSLALLQRVHGA